MPKRKSSKENAKSGVKKWSAKGECKGGVQRVECKRGECSADRNPETHVNTLVCLRPRADSIAYAHSARPRFEDYGLLVRGVVVRGFAALLV